MNKTYIQSVMISLASLLIVNLIFAYLLPTPSNEDIVSWIISNIFIIMIIVISWVQLPSASLRSATTIFLAVSIIIITEIVLSLLLILFKADLRTTLFMEAAMFLLFILTYSVACYFTADDITINKSSVQATPRQFDYKMLKTRKPKIK